MSCRVKNIYFVNFYKKTFPPHSLMLWFSGKIDSIHPLVFSGHIFWSKKNVILDISQTEGSEFLIKLSKAMIYVEKFSLSNPTLLCRVNLHIFKKGFNVNFVFISMRICHLLVAVFIYCPFYPCHRIYRSYLCVCERENVSVRWKTLFLD